MKGEWGVPYEIAQEAMRNIFKGQNRGWQLANPCFNDQVSENNKVNPCYPVKNGPLLELPHGKADRYD